jgi:hypothetical protein
VVVTVETCPPELEQDSGTVSGCITGSGKRTKVTAGRGTGTVGPSTGTSIGNGLEARNLDRYCNGY